VGAYCLPARCSLRASHSRHYDLLGSTHPVHTLTRTLRPPLPPTIRTPPQNFTKFLVDRSGKVVERYSPTSTPESIAKDIEKLL
jgi:glutathione peroxidase-family protein